MNKDIPDNRPLDERIELALEEIARIATNRESFHMSIPPQPNDSDILIYNALVDAKQAIEEFSRERENIFGLLDEQKWVIRRLMEDKDME